jgi:hypothetical protein
MIKNPEPIVCVHCEKTRENFRKRCEKVLTQLQREATQIKAGVESKFLEVMKEAIEDSITQVTEGEENANAKAVSTNGEKDRGTGSKGSEIGEESETEEESSTKKEAVA